VLVVELQASQACEARGSQVPESDQDSEDSEPEPPSTRARHHPSPQPTVSTSGEQEENIHSASGERRRLLPRARQVPSPGNAAGEKPAKRQREQQSREKELTYAWTNGAQVPLHSEIAKLKDEQLARALAHHKFVMELPEDYWSPNISTRRKRGTSHQCSSPSRAMEASMH